MSDYHEIFAVQEAIGEDTGVMKGVYPLWNAI